MKEATGELNMTVVTLIAVAALAALFYFVVWPMVQRMVVQQTCNTYGNDWKATRSGSIDNATGSRATVGNWQCCNADNSQCIDVSEDDGKDGGGDDTSGNGE